MVKKVVNGIEYEWSDTAIDYSEGVTPALYIPESKTYLEFLEEDVPNLPPDIRSRLVSKPNKIGAWVLTEKGVKTLKSW